MGKALHKLLSIASESFCTDAETEELSFSAANARAGIELVDLLDQKNGFFAFESALRLFPSCSSPFSYSLTEWNSTALWRHDYGDLTGDHFFFAEDIFGVQFCLKDNAVYSFDPETAEIRRIGTSIEEWAAAILKDYSLLTGYTFAHQWQALNGRLLPKQRLMPKTPFVLGGEFAVANLYAIEAAQGMRARGNLARQIYNLPDGAQITFNIID